jgi:cell division protein ZapA (FtsZ GTPase activity inhibitor)
MSTKRIITFSLLDKSYTISTDEDESLIYRAANSVDGVLREISKQLKSSPEMKVALFSALKIAVDLEKARLIEQTYTTACQEVIGLLEKELKLTL